MNARHTNRFEGARWSRLALATWGAALALLLASCLPATSDPRPAALVLGVPVDQAVPGASAGLQARLAPLDSGHRLISDLQARFLEERSGLAVGIVNREAARAARRMGAQVAVLVLAVERDREILHVRDGRREQRTTLRLEVVLVRAEDGEELARLAGPRARSSGWFEGEELPREADDVAFLRLRDQGLDAVAPAVARELRFLAEAGAAERP